MAVSFTKAPEVSVGQVVSSADLTQQNNALNDRLRSGLGEPWRILYLWFTLFRQVRNPADGAFPSQSEFFQVYQFINAEHATWPVVNAEDPEGANLANQLNAFVFGAGIIQSESDRFNVPLLIGGNPPVTVAEFWDLAKTQRGGIDPVTNARAAPFLDAAESHNALIQPADSPYANAFGAMLPAVSGHGSAELRKTYGFLLERVLSFYAAEFRGTEEQRGLKKRWNGEAFDFQKFLASQFMLAPAFGVEVGETVVVDYPELELDVTGELPAGTSLLVAGNQFIQVPHKFVIAACWITIDGVEGNAVTLDFIEGTTVYESRTIELVNGLGEAIHIFKNARRANPFGIKVRNPISRAASVDGHVKVEVAQLLDYKPLYSDAYALLRLAGANTPSPLDGSGTSEDQCRRIFSEFAISGTAQNYHGQSVLDAPTSAVNTNGVFDSARRLSKMVRLIPRRQFVGYEVANSKSILYFRRYSFGLDEETIVDLFEGIAPNVDGGENGIVTIAPKQGWSNEWLMAAEFKAYSDGESSIWRPEAYADLFALNNRCLFYSPEVATDFFLNQHLAFGQSTDTGNLIAEAPSSFNYFPLNSLNQITCPSPDAVCEEWRRNFFKSCRIYEPWPELESATVQTEDGIEIVKITFKTRLRNTFSTTTIPRDVGTWDAATIAAEPFRCDENALREYLLNQFNGVNDCTAGGVPPSVGTTPTGQPGNAAANSNVQGIHDIHGACFPDFAFVKLIPQPYADMNDVQDDHDSPLIFDHEVQKEIYLRAICESFVDAETTEVQNCLAEFSGVYNFTYENLCLQAFGVPWMPLMGVVDRADKPRGFAPFPNTKLRAERFNQFSKALNLLDRVPLFLPMNLECRTRIDGATGKSVSPEWPIGATCGLPSSSSNRCLVKVEDLEMAEGSWSAWSNCGATIDASSVSGLLENACGTGGQFELGQTSNVVETRQTLVESDYIHALPPTISDMVETAAIGFMAEVFTQENYFLRSEVTVSTEADLCGATRFFTNGLGYKMNNVGSSLTLCKILEGGVHDANLAFPPRGDTSYQGDAGAACVVAHAATIQIKNKGLSNHNFLRIPVV